MKDLDLFLQESNNIEDVWDDQSLKQAKKAWDFLIKQDKLTPDNIRKAHGILMKYRLEKEFAGHFRKQPVWIGGHEAKPWYIIPEFMDFFCNTIPTDIKTLEHTKNWHKLFESCHPFIDGNGRIGRIIMNWQRVKSNLPILVIYESKKYDYYKWF